MPRATRDHSEKSATLPADEGFSGPMSAGGPSEKPLLSVAGVSDATRRSLLAVLAGGAASVAGGGGVALASAEPDLIYGAIAQYNSTLTAFGTALDRMAELETALPKECQVAIYASAAEAPDHPSSQACVVGMPLTLGDDPRWTEILLAKTRLGEANLEAMRALAETVPTTLQGALDAIRFVTQRVDEADALFDEDCAAAFLENVGACIAAHLEGHDTASLSLF